MPESFATLWTVARQSPLSMGISQARILEWVAGDLSDPGIEPSHPLSLLHWQVDYLSLKPSGKANMNFGGTQTFSR